MEKVELRFKLKGDLQKSPRYRNLLPLVEAKEVYELLESAPFRQTPQGILRNRTLASRVFSRYLDENRIDLPFDDFLLVIERLTSSQTGMPLELSGDGLSQAMILIVSTTTPFEGVASTVFKEQAR